MSGYTLLEIKIDTGRTHQIRVHMAEIGHPVVRRPSILKRKKSIRSRKSNATRKIYRICTPNNRKSTQNWSALARIFRKHNRKEHIMTQIRLQKYLADARNRIKAHLRTIHNKWTNNSKWKNNHTAWNKNRPRKRQNNISRKICPQ